MREEVEMPERKLRRSDHFWTATRMSGKIDWFNTEREAWAFGTANAPVVRVDKEEKGVMS